jgi:hypothetical protein
MRSIGLAHLADGLARLNFPDNSRQLFVGIVRIVSGRFGPECYRLRNMQKHSRLKRLCVESSCPVTAEVTGSSPAAPAILTVSSSAAHAEQPLAERALWRISFVPRRGTVWLPGQSSARRSRPSSYCSAVPRSGRFPFRSGGPKKRVGSRNQKPSAVHIETAAVDYPEGLKILNARGKAFNTSWSLRQWR